MPHIVLYPNKSVTSAFHLSLCAPQCAKRNRKNNERDQKTKCTRKKKSNQTKQTKRTKRIEGKKKEYIEKTRNSALAQYLLRFRRFICSDINCIYFQLNAFHNAKSNTKFRCNAEQKSLEGLEAWAGNATKLDRIFRKYAENMCVPCRAVCIVYIYLVRIHNVLLPASACQWRMVKQWQWQAASRWSTVHGPSVHGLPKCGARQKP